MASESFSFDADIQQLLNLIVNAFYSDKSVFIRELLANSSDALDKIRYESLTDPKALATDPELRIRVIPDKEAKTLVIEDSGIGMSREELVKNLGTVAKSGTKAFMEAITASADSKLIGQFGVGFYSSFLVADRVSVVSRKNGSDGQYRWESSADGSFAVSADSTEPPLARGTRLTLHIKEGMLEYLEEFRLRQLISRHCAFISFPIELFVTKTIDVPAEGEAAGGDDGDREDGKVADAGSDEKPRTEKKEIQEYQRVNTQQPIWLKAPKDVAEEEYKEFYKAISGDFDDYAVKRHFIGEGTVEFQALLFVPKRPPFDMLMGVQNNKKQTNVKLYARKVMIMDAFDEFLPPYLSFVRGVVNSDDIPLNVSRELLQDNKMLKFIARNLVRRCLDMFKELSEDKEAFKSFYDAFSTNIKLGVHEDVANRARLLELLRFPSNKTLAAAGSPEAAEWTSLPDYVGRMNTDEKSIYFITGESLTAVDSSPFMERFKKLGKEVLYMVQPIDEYVMEALQGSGYSEKSFVNITKAGVKIDGAPDGDDEASLKDTKAAFELVCEAIKKITGEKLDKVEVSRQIVDSPAVLIAPQYGLSANMERIMKAQALQSQEQRFMLDPRMMRKSMLLNPDHELIIALRGAVEKAGVDKAAEDEGVRAQVELLFDTAQLLAGFSLDDPSGTSKRIHRLMLSKL